MRTSAGQKLYRRIHVKVIDGGKTQILQFKAYEGHAFTQDQIGDKLDELINHLDKTYPKTEFRMVQIAENAYNFIAEGERGRISSEYQDATGDTEFGADGSGGSERLRSERP